MEKGGLHMQKTVTLPHVLHVVMRYHMHLYTLVSTRKNKDFISKNKDIKAEQKRW